MSTTTTDTTPRTHYRVELRHAPQHECEINDDDYLAVGAQWGTWEDEDPDEVVVLMVDGDRRAAESLLERDARVAAWERVD